MINSHQSETHRSSPIVSVAVTAFNLAELLPRALDSILRQKMDLPYEIVIGDDCSTDNTVFIARSYRERYPSVIRIIERSKNVGIQRNTWDTLNQCRGKYTAWLDADDCWTDPDKLAIQVAAMESDSSISVCCSFVRWVSLDGEVKKSRYPNIPAGRYGLDEILRHNFIPGLSTVFRTGIHLQLPEWYFGFKSLSDWPLWVLSALYGDVILLDRVMADYTLTPGSSMMSKGALFWNEMAAEFYEKIESVIPGRWHRLIHSEKGKRYESIAYLLRKQGDFIGSREAAIQALISPSLFDNCGSKSKALLASLTREAQWKIRKLIIPKTAR